MARKTELKQKQSQKVIVNINTEKKKKRSKPRQRQEAKPVQPAQTISQAFPYLGLQSANNAQLLNSLQNSLNMLYAKTKTATVAPPPSFATALATPPAPAPVAAPTPIPTPTLAPAPAPILTRPPPPPIPTPAPAPPPSAAPVYPRPRPPQRIPAEEPAIARPSREPVAQVTGAVRGSYDLDTNKDGTVRKRGDKWKALPQEVRDLIIEEELSAKPVKAKLIKDEEDTDAEVVQKKTRRKKQPENIEVDNSIPIEDTNVKEAPKEKSKQKFNEEANKVEKAILSQVLHTKTEIKPEPPPKTLLSLLPGSKSSKVAVATGDQTDYVDLVSESESF
jgi:hypothetical protein